MCIRIDVISDLLCSGETEATCSVVCLILLLELVLGFKKKTLSLLNNTSVNYIVHLWAANLLTQQMWLVLAAKRLACNN